MSQSLKSNLWAIFYIFQSGIGENISINDWKRLIEELQKFPVYIKQLFNKITTGSKKANKYLRYINI